MRPPSKQMPGVNRLKSLRPDLDGWGTSAMKASMQSRILNGRPFGGTGFLWSKAVSQSIKPRTNYQNDRVTVLELNSSAGPILIINCYLPYFKSSDVSQLNLYMETIGFIGSIMDDYLGSNFILIGDFNCDIFKGRNDFSNALNNFIHDRDLYCTFNSMSSFNPDCDYTRFNLKQNSYSLLDYVFVSKNLTKFIDKVTIIDPGTNLSDHLPVHVAFSFDLTSSNAKPMSTPSLIDWRRIDESTRLHYEKTMENYLDQIRVPHIVHGDSICSSVDHLFEIERYYADIVKSIQLLDVHLPRCKPALRKTFWNDELTALKNDSIIAHDFWKQNGCPRNGPVFEAKKHAYYRYKLCIRNAKRDVDQDKSDRLNDNLSSGNVHRFWKSFKHLNGVKASPSPLINDLSDDNDIANCFARSYESIYESVDRSQSSKLSSEFSAQYENYTAEHCNDSIRHLSLTWPDMLDVMSSLKSGKATASFVKPEHVLYGSPKLVWHLHLLFNAMIVHSYVPSDFLQGVISPLIKDSEGDHTSPDNYRPLTLSVLFSNLFEHALLRKIGHLLDTDALQFGYKRRHSTSHAIFALRSCIEYFVDRGSSVFVAFLDCSKGFDIVNHSGLFIKLMKRGIPLCILNLLIYWYSNLTSRVKWNNVFSNSFQVPSGVRQGGVLSPHFFVIYIDDLIVYLRNLKIGCHIIDLFIACIVYADDICLVAPCRSALQTLLDACESYANSWCLSYNPSKCKVMAFGSHVDSPVLRMYGKTLEFVQTYKYLGINVTAGSKFSASSLKPLMRFRSSANCILNTTSNSSEPVLMKLLYSICVPHLTYATDVIPYSSRQLQPMNVALNDCIRRVFGYNRWESVRYLRLSLGYPSLTDIIHARCRKFHRRLPTIGNSTLSHLASRF